MNEQQNEKPSGIPYGLLWGMLVLILYIYGYFALGIVLVWKTGMPQEWGELVRLVLSSVGYLKAG